MKNILFNKYFLAGVVGLSICILLLGASNMADLLDPSRVDFRRMQEQRANNEKLLLDLKIEHDKLVDVRDKLAVKLGNLNKKILEVEEKGKKIRQTNDDITSKIENGEKQPSVIPQAQAAELDEQEPIVKIETQENANKEVFDLDKLALAVGRHETGNCTLGYGKMYNNCVGMKSGNTAPCPVKNGVKQIGRNNMCIYDDPQQSYDAFKIVWAKWYGELPNAEMAKRYSGNDRAEIWRKNVINFYYQS